MWAWRDVFARRLEQAVLVACSHLVPQVGGERLYALALYTSGQDAFSYVCASANTEEALTRAAGDYAARRAGYAGEAGRDRLRWSACDWAWHDFSDEVRALELPTGDTSRRDRGVYRAFIDALAAVERRGGLAGLPTRPILAVMCGDLDDDFLLRSVAALNPPHQVEACRHQLRRAAAALGSG